MMREKIGPSGGERILGFGRNGYRRLNIIATVAAVGVFMWPLAGIAGEAANGGSVLPQGTDTHDGSAGPHVDTIPATQEATAPLRTNGFTIDWSVVLPTLAASPEKRELIANLDALIRQGNVAQAQQLLSAVVETGSFALLISDHVADPALQASLQKLASDGLNSSTSAPANSGAGTTASSAKLTELQEALDRERERADAAQEKLSAMTADSAKTAELADALKREKEQAASTARDLQAAQEQLNVVREQLNSARSNETKTAELSDAATREKNRADAALSELQKSQEQLAALRTGAADASALKTALEQEREKATSTARELDTVKEHLAAMSLTAAEAKEALRQEKDKVAASLRELHSANEQLAALEEQHHPNPARLDLELPFMLRAPSAFSLPNRAEQKIRKDRGHDVPRKTQQVSLPESGASSEPARKTAPPPQVRHPQQPKERKLSKPSDAAKTAAIDKKPPAKQNRKPRTIIPDSKEWPDAGALNLPAALLPDTRLWQLE